MLAIPHKRHGLWLLGLLRRRWAPTAIAALWAGWWSFFMIASAASEPNEGNSAIPWIFFVALPIAVMWFAVVSSVLWRKAAIALMLVVGAIVLIGYPFAATPQFGAGTIAFVMSTLGLPPLVAGMLLLWQRKARASSDERQH